MEFVIVPDRNCPTYAPLPGWRGWLNRWLRIPFRRGRVVFSVGNQLVCSPATAAALAAYLVSVGHTYKIRPNLEVVK